MYISLFDCRGSEFNCANVKGFLHGLGTKPIYAIGNFKCRCVIVKWLVSIFEKKQVYY